MIYFEKDLNLTIGILAANKTFEQIRATYESLGVLKYPVQRLVNVPEDYDVTELKNRKYNFIQKGKTLTSLIDGLCKEAKTEWIYFAFAGRKVQKNIDSKYSIYASDYKNVIFPVVKRVWNFVDGSMDGLLINKKFHEEVGEFGDGDDLEITKLMWAGKAVEKGAKFKAIVGAAY
jgi:hypothetical protein